MRCEHQGLLLDLYARSRVEISDARQVFNCAPRFRVSVLMVLTSTFFSSRKEKYLQERKTRRLTASSCSIRWISSWNSIPSSLPTHMTSQEEKGRVSCAGWKFPGKTDTGYENRPNKQCLRRRSSGWGTEAAVSEKKKTQK